MDDAAVHEQRAVRPGELIDDGERRCVGGLLDVDPDVERVPEEEGVLQGGEETGQRVRTVVGDDADVDRRYVPVCEICLGPRTACETR